MIGKMTTPGPSQEDKVRWNETYNNHPHSNVFKIWIMMTGVFLKIALQIMKHYEIFKWHQLCRLSDKDRLIGDNDNRCTQSKAGMLENNHRRLFESFDSETEIDIDEIEAVRHRIQQFDPLGVASLTIDCLMVQLAHLDKNTPWREKLLMLLINI